MYQFGLVGKTVTLYRVNGMKLEPVATGATAQEAADKANALGTENAAAIKKALGRKARNIP